MFSFSSLKDSNRPECFLDEHGSVVILLLLQMEGLGDTIRELEPASDEIRGLSETGDFIGSFFGCLPSDGLSDFGIHFASVLLSSLSKA